MKKRTLGTNGPRVSAIGLGCMSMAGSYGPADDKESLKTLDRALELGIDLIDTADVYGRGRSGEFLNGWLKGKRERVFLASKCGITIGPNGMGVDNRPEYIRACCDASLKRLGVDVIDLYYLHRIDPAVPIEDAMGAFLALKGAGKIRYIGLSEATAATIARAAKVAPIAAVQSEMSLWTRDNEFHQLPKTQELGIAFAAYSPLGRGMLTARITSTDDLQEGDPRKRQPRFSQENFATNQALVARVAAMAAGKGITPGQLAIAWLLHKSDNIIALPGTKQRRYLEENAAAAEVSLTAADMAKLEAIMPPNAAAGARYSPDQQARINR